MLAALSVSGVSKIYAGGVKALDGLDFEIKAGEMLALLGANGAGKTTLIGIICGLVKKTDGSVKVFGFDLDREPEKVKGCIGIVPQEFNFNIFETPLNIVVDAAGYYGVSRKIALARAEQLLRDLGLWEKRNEPSRTLSGGMKRRLLIARALVHEPKLLLLDEPSAGVDVELRREMWEFVKGLNNKGVTIVLTTHYLEEAERLCRDLIILKNGSIIQHGIIEDLVKASGMKTLEEYYLSI